MTASPLPRSRPTITTLAPMLASPMAVALPMPEVAPVIRQTFSPMPPPCFSHSGLSISHSLRFLKEGIRWGPGRWLPVTSSPPDWLQESTFRFASHGDDDFSSSVSLLQIPDGLGGLGERVRPVDDRCELAGFD